MLYKGAIAWLVLGTNYLLKNREKTSIKDNNSITINGTYNQEISDYGTLYQYIFDNGNVKYIAGVDRYIGTYTQTNNTLYITYTEKFDGTGESVPLDLNNDELIIESENKLICTRYDNAYIKEENRISTDFIGNWTDDTE